MENNTRVSTESNTAKPAYTESQNKMREAVETLEMMEPKILASFIVNEHPQTIALILSILTASGTAMKVIRALPEKSQADISFRLLTMKAIPEGVYYEVLDVLMKMIKASGAEDLYSRQTGLDSFARMMENAEEVDKKYLLELMEESTDAETYDAELLKQVKEKIKEIKP